VITVGSLFSGIGGLDLGLERAGMVVKWQSEIDPYACKVLNKHWPDVPNLGDIKTINWKETEKVDVICGGYPCQPFSQAGRRRGKEDKRHLWPWVRDAISELRPRYAILENVRGHLSMGGLSVVSELTAIGYDCEWRIISAASLGANHKRDRIFIVAYADGDNSTDGGQRTVIQSENSSWGNDRGRGNTWQIGLGGSGEVTNGLADADNSGERAPRRRDYREWSEVEQGRQNEPQPELGRQRKTLADADFRRLKECNTQQRRFSIFNEDSPRKFFSHWEIEPDVGRVADGVPYRVDRLKGLGNAVVPQVAEIVGRLIVGHYSNDY
jgi:DNA (cytosine-5)-methyltransferase 1